MKTGHRLVQGILRGMVVLVALWAFYPSTAHAYVDPGAGSLVLQVVAASVLGAVFFIKQWYRAVRDAFRAAWARWQVR